MKIFFGSEKKICTKRTKEEGANIENCVFRFFPKKLPNPTKNQKVGVGQKYTNAAPTKVTQLHWDSTYSPQIISQDMYTVLYVVPLSGD